MTIGGCLLSAVIGAVFVRLMLGALDAQPYDGERTERAYVIVAVAALTMWWGGTILSVFLGRRALRVTQRRGRHPEREIDQTGASS